VTHTHTYTHKPPLVIAFARIGKFVFITTIVFHKAFGLYTPVNCIPMRRLFYLLYSREVPRRACPEAQEGRGRDEPLRREVPRRACPEAQEGRAWLPVEPAVMSRCVGRFPAGHVPRRRRVVAAMSRCVGRFPAGHVPKRRRVVLGCLSSRP